MNYALCIMHYALCIMNYEFNFYSFFLLNRR